MRARAEFASSELQGKRTPQADAPLVITQMSLIQFLRSAIQSLPDGFGQGKRSHPWRTCLGLAANRHSKTAGTPVGRENQVRLMKMLGLAAIAAVAAMAFIGAPSASATESTLLCKTTPEAGELKCPTGQQVTTIHAEATGPLLSTSLASVLCASSLVKVSVLGLGTAPNRQLGHIEELTWNTCHRHSGQSCTVTNLLLGLVHALKLSLSVVDVSVTGTSVRVQCGILIDCTFKAGPETEFEGLPLTSHTAGATLHANAEAVERDNNHHVGICPATATWTALYTALLDSPVHFGS
jgi:hypothetical protein